VVCVRALRLLPLLVLTLGLACSAFETNLQDTDVSYQKTARQNFESAEEAFAEERYNEAVKFFEHVKNKFPYSKYAVLADLRVADAHFAREKWLEAADAYRLFVRFHPRHEKVGYATFRIAKAYFNETDDGAFSELLFGTAAERDQTATRDAIRAFDDYLSRFPEGEHVEEARELRVHARTKLAEHDLYAAAFYAQRDKHMGALWRYQRIANEFADTPLAPRALLLAGQLQRDELEDADAARASFERLLKEHPEAEEAEDARAALASL
jgi:outer membrane protein assembly factor BamD